MLREGLRQGCRNCCTQICPPNLVRADDNTRTLPLPLAINWGTFYPRELVALVTRAPPGESIPLLKPSHFSFLSVSLLMALVLWLIHVSEDLAEHFSPFLIPASLLLWPHSPVKARDADLTAGHSCTTAALLPRLQPEEPVWLAPLSGHSVSGDTE